VHVDERDMSLGRSMSREVLSIDSDGCEARDGFDVSESEQDSKRRNEMVKVKQLTRLKMPAVNLVKSILLSKQ